MGSFSFVVNVIVPLCDASVFQDMKTQKTQSEKIDLLCKKGSMHNLVAVFVMRQSLDEKLLVFFKTH